MKKDVTMRLIISALNVAVMNGRDDLKPEYLRIKTMLTNADDADFAALVNYCFGRILTKSLDVEAEYFEGWLAEYIRCLRGVHVDHLARKSKVESAKLAQDQQR